MRSILSVAAGLMLALAACEAGPDGESGSNDETSVQGVAVFRPDGGVKLPVQPPSGRCVVDSDCRIFADYCGGCNCRALPKDFVVIQGCQGHFVACFRDPCGGNKAACERGTCVARSTGVRTE
jgi:hypothetical protein